MLYYFKSVLHASASERSAIQFLHLSQQAGTSSVLVTTDGLAPLFVMSDIPVLAWGVAKSRMVLGDVVVADHPDTLDECGARAGVCFLHDQRTDTLVEYDHRSSRLLVPCIKLGQAVSPYFYYAGQIKAEDSVAVDVPSTNWMWSACIDKWPALDYLDVADGHHELEIARRLCQASICMFTELYSSPQRYLEAMAAGNTLLVVDHGGLPDLVQHGGNAWVSKPENVVDVLGWLIQPEQAVLRMSLRHGAMSTAARMDEASYINQLKRLLRNMQRQQVAA